jgi:epoxyqueuosine reductase
MTEVAEDLHQRLAEAGFRSAIVSTRRLPDLRADLERLLSDGILDRCFYNELRRRHDLDFQFEVPADFPAARSIISIAAPQPKVSVGFRLSGRTYHLLIPPTYTYDTDKTASRIISECLLEYGYGAKSARLPQKPLVVHCGLAAYGRNNITYIDGLGSFHRPGAFFSDLPPGPDCWQDLRMMDRCEDCFACGKRCPTGAITGE